MEPNDDDGGVIEVGSDTDEEVVKAKKEEGAGVASGVKEEVAPSDGASVPGDGASVPGDGGSDTDSSLSATGAVVESQVNALFTHHWVKQPLDEERSPVAEITGFTQNQVRGGCK